MGAVRAVEAIAKGLSWVRVKPPIEIVGEVTAAHREQCWDLGALSAFAATERSAP